MQLSKIFPIGLVAFTTLAVSVPSVEAHNTSKYTNVPFVVAAECLNFDSGVSSSFVNAGKGLQLRLVINGEGDAGCDVMCSNPSTNGSLNGTFSQGSLSFTQNGLPSSGQITSVVVYSDNSTLYPTPVVSGSSVTISTVNVSNPSLAILRMSVGISTNGYVAPLTGPPYATMFLSNFRLNGNSQTLLFDTTFTDLSNTSFPNYCSF